MRDEENTPRQMIPGINSACLSYSKHNPLVDDCIAVAERAELVLKNCPSAGSTMKDGNCQVEDSEKREASKV